MFSENSLKKFMRPGEVPLLLPTRIQIKFTLVQMTAMDVLFSDWPIKMVLVILSSTVNSVKC